MCEYISGEKQWSNTGVVTRFAVACRTVESLGQGKLTIPGIKPCDVIAIWPQSKHLLVIAQLTLCCYV